MASKGTKNTSFFNTTHGFNICHCKNSVHMRTYVINILCIVWYFLYKTFNGLIFYRSDAAGYFSNSVLSGVEKIKGNMDK